MRKRYLFPALMLVLLLTVLSGTALASDGEVSPSFAPSDPQVTVPATCPDGAHQWDNGVVTKAPTCTEDGERTFTCTVCQATKTEAIKATGHKWDKGTVIKAPTCTTAGQMEYTCTRCGATKQEPIDKLGHDWDDGTITKEPGCDEIGTIVYHCSRCDRSRTDALPSLGHDWDDGTVTKEPTCTQDGVLQRTCSRCGAKRTSVLEALGHDWDQGTVTEEPTRFHEGVRQFTCLRCGDHRTQRIPVLDGGNPFEDITEGQYYTEPVFWALDHSITTGMDTSHFGPELPCTRAQVVTFLWRAAGEPEPNSKDCAFTDLDSSQYYYKAVLWAVEQHITTGMDDSHFGPELPCTRAQVVTFLWRAAEEPEADSAVAAFTDIEDVDYAKTAIAWAAEKAITDGTGNGCFSPDLTCSRAQIVTFLYRANQ